MIEKKLKEAIEILMEECCEHIPDGYEIVISMREQEASLDFYTPEGDECCAPDDTTAAQQVMLFIDWARDRDGLTPRYDLEMVMDSPFAMPESYAFIAEDESE